jgi:hypothetical protein
MKNLSHAALLAIALAAASPLLKAQSVPPPPPPNNQNFNQGSIYSEEAEALSPTRVDRPNRTVPQGSTEYAIASLLRTETTHAGASTATEDGKDMKSLVAPSVNSSSSTEEGFSEPAAYAEYKFSQIQDKTPAFGQDGPQQNGIVGFDFISYYNTIVGLNFTYTNENLFSGSADQFQTSNNSYFFSPYIAKNFADWVNVGGSFTYGRSDTTFRTSLIPVLQNTTQDSYAVSPFIGIAHTFGAFSFSSTPTYIWGYDHFSFGNTDLGGFEVLPPPDAKTLNQTFLWLNNFSYAVTDKLSLSVQANWSRILTSQQITVPGSAPVSVSHQWVSFGGRVDYTFNKNATVFGAFEHDAFNVNFDDYRIRTGITYNF